MNPFHALVRQLGIGLLAVSCALAAADPYDQSGVSLELESSDPMLAKIVILAGDPSSKAMAHEYFAGGAVLMALLKQTPGVWPVMVRGWPKNESVLKGAKTIVYYGDGGGKQPFLEPKRWETFSRLMDSGTGLVLLHQAVDFPKGPAGDKIKDWVGGVFRSDYRLPWSLGYGIHGNSRERNHARSEAVLRSWRRLALQSTFCRRRGSHAAAYWRSAG